MIVPGEDSPKVATALAKGTYPLHLHAFDVLAVAGTDVTHLTWSQRRPLLEKIAEGFGAPLTNLVASVTPDQATFEAWVAEGEEARWSSATRPTGRAPGPRSGRS